MPIRNIALFVSNTVIVNNNVDVGACYGSGPIRMVETDTTWRVVLIDDGGIISTLFEIDKSAADNSFDKDTPLFRIEDRR